MLAKTKPCAWELVPNFNIGTSANTASQNKSIVRGIAYHNKVYRAVHSFVKANADLGYSFMQEPWFRQTEVQPGNKRKKMCQPDGVLVDNFTGGALVVEVKLNWKDGRDEKLIDLYLHATKSALAVEEVWPVLITQNVAGYKGRPLLGLHNLERAFEWRPGQLTPVLLLP